MLCSSFCCRQPLAMNVFPSEGFKITTSSEIRWDRIDDMVLASDVKLAYAINGGSGKVSKDKRRKRNVSPLSNRNISYKWGKEWRKTHKKTWQIP